MVIPVKIRDVSFDEVMADHDLSKIVTPMDEARAHWAGVRGTIVTISVPAISFKCSAGGRMFDIFPEVRDRHGRIGAVCEHQVELED